MKVAAIWARVSTSDQRELSLDGQVERVKAKLEGMGYLVPPERILAVDWTSLDLYSCPQFQELRRWVRTREIQAVGVLDRDRLAAQGLQRLNFLADCKDTGVELIPYQGPPMLEGPEGQLVELALAIGKERSVERAQQGAKQGLVDRARLKGLAPTNRPPFGYQFEDGGKRLVPTSDWDTAALIWELALMGTPLRGMVKELKRRGIPTLTGKPTWAVPTLYGILLNPVYCGRYEALRWESITPKNRRNGSYGKSSQRRREGITLPVVVERPVVTQEQFDYVQARLAQNKRDSMRNAKRAYLLRGLIFYEGTGLRFRGRRNGKSWSYEYRNDDAPLRYLAGPALERQIWDKAVGLLTGDALESELGRREATLSESIARLEGELGRLNRKAEDNLNAEGELVGLRIRGKVSDTAYERNLVLLKAEKTYIQDERQRIKGEIGKLRGQSFTQEAIAQLRQQVAERLSTGTFEDRRFVLEALGTRVMVTTEGKLEVEFSIPSQPVQDAIVLARP